jgi:thiamine transport system ATP-binding protein
VTGPGLSTVDLAIGYPSRVVGTGITLDVLPGEIVAIIGASGSGKSTLLSTLAGVVPALSGRILMGAVDVTNTPIHQRGIGLIFQEPLLFPHLSVLGNVTYGLRRQGESRRAAEARAVELLAWLDLPEYGNRPVDELSGGQAQRVALARALAPRPAVLLLDEPFSALDVDLRQRLATDVAATLRHEGVGAIHVTHDPNEAREIADRVLTMVQISSASGSALR